jgi:hypothetical protein
MAELVHQKLPVILRDICGAFHLWAIWILMKQHCSYLTEYVFRAHDIDTL